MHVNEDPHNLLMKVTAESSFETLASANRARNQLVFWFCVDNSTNFPIDFILMCIGVVQSVSRIGFEYFTHKHHNNPMQVIDINIPEALVSKSDLNTAYWGQFV